MQNGNSLTSMHSVNPTTSFLMVITQGKAKRLAVFQTVTANALLIQLTRWKTIVTKLQKERILHVTGSGVVLNLRKQLLGLKYLFFRTGFTVLRCEDKLLHLFATR